MKKHIALVLALALAALPTAAASNSMSRVASQAWVLQVLSSYQRQTSSTTATNAFTEAFLATATVVTNDSSTRTVSSPFTSSTVTNAAYLSLTFRTSLLPASALNSWNPFSLFLSAFADEVTADTEDHTFTLYVSSGYWQERDASGNLGSVHPFNFTSPLKLTRDVTWAKIPSSKHECTFVQGGDCRCIDKDNTIDSIEVPSCYTAASKDTFLNDWADDPYAWIDSKSLPSCIKFKESKAKYYVTDNSGLVFPFDEIANSAAWQAGLAEIWDEYKGHMDECAVAYKLSRVCTGDGEQHHLWKNHSCGSHTFQICTRNPDHTQGEKGHEFPGASAGASGHYCKCGRTTEGHGDLVLGTQTEGVGCIYYTLVCPKGCGYSDDHVHYCTHVNCGTCQTEDILNCSKPCTCSGEHVWGTPTASECAKCTCSGSSSCNATPPNSNISLHGGWLPCGQDTEGDNDDGTANGAHCQCQCHAYGHNAQTSHDYQLPSGSAEYEEIAGDDVNHFHLLGKCSRCEQWKKQKTRHTYSETKKFKNISDTQHKGYVTCTVEGCAHKKYDEPAYHSRDANNECKCVADCGYQYQHVYQNSPCGNSECTYCHKDNPDNTTDNHSGWTPIDNTETHKCACHHQVIKNCEYTWVESGTSIGLIIYTGTCICNRTKTKSEACPHASWSAWTAISSDGVYTTWQKTCLKCSYAITQTTANKPGEDTCYGAYHVPVENACGCKCGNGGKTASTDKRWHKWNASDIQNGVANCRCRCGKLHEFRSGGLCPSVCACCKSINSSEQTATDADHTPKDYSDHACGCKCGKITHSTSVYALHIQSNGYGSLPVCQCFGDGSGGTKHYQTTSSTCTKICPYKWPGDADWGHFKAEAAVETGIRAATPSDHTGKDYGCGCKCGWCNKDTNRNSWLDVSALHKAAQGDTYACKCECGERNIGEDSTYPGHTFGKPNIPACTCTCGEKHKDDNLNACGMCTVCGKIQYNGKMVDDDAALHKHASSTTCHCLCGKYMNSGGHMIGPEGTVFANGSCDCLCKIAGCTGSSISGGCAGGISFYHNWRYYINTRKCRHCGKREFLGHSHKKSQYFKSHSSSADFTGCYACGCVRTGGNCSGHYCKACCTSKPKNPRNQSANYYEDPIDPDHTHSYTTQTLDESWECESCLETFTCSGTYSECTICGYITSSSLTYTGTHKSTCPYYEDTNSTGDDDGENADITTCPNCGHDYHLNACTVEGCTCATSVDTDNGTTSGNGSIYDDDDYSNNPYTNGTGANGSSLIAQ